MPEEALKQPTAREVTAEDLGIEPEREVPFEETDAGKALEGFLDEQSDTRAELVRTRERLARHADEAAPKQEEMPKPKGPETGTKSPEASKFEKGKELMDSLNMGGASKSYEKGTFTTRDVEGDLDHERGENQRNRKKVFEKTFFTGVVAGTVTMAGLGIDSLAGGSVLGVGGTQLLADSIVSFAGLGGLGVAAGGLVYSGMKIYHSFKERAHREKFREIFGYKPRSFIH